MPGIFVAGWFPRSVASAPDRPAGGLPSPPGSSTTKVAPPPGVASTDTRPPWALTTASTIDSPRPVPPLARTRDGSARQKRSKM